MVMSSPRETIKQEIWRDPSLDLNALLLKSPEPQEIIGSMLRAAGFPYVICVEHGETTEFHAGHLENAMNRVLQLQTDRTLHGSHVELVHSVFLIVKGIEGTLTDAAYLHPVRRVEKIDEFCRSVGVDKDLFLTVVRNW